MSAENCPCPGWMELSGTLGERRIWMASRVATRYRTMHTRMGKNCGPGDDLPWTFMVAVPMVRRMASV